MRENDAQGGAKTRKGAKMKRKGARRRGKCRGGWLTGVAFSPHGGSALPARPKRSPRTEEATSPHGEKGARRSDKIGQT